MAIDIETVRSQQKELNMVSDEVSSVRRKLKHHQETLDDAWRSPEVKGIDLAIEEILRRLNRLAGDLENLGHDVMVTGEEIKAEEEAAAAEEARRLAATAAAEEARRRAAAEAVAEEARKCAAAAAEEEARRLAATKTAAEATRKLLEKSKIFGKK